MAGRRTDLSAAVQALAPVQRQMPVEPAQPRRAMPPQVRAQLQDCLRGLRRRASPWEHWCNGINQAGIDLLVMHGHESSGRVLERFRLYGVIDAENRLVPREKRADYAIAEQQERALLRAEVEAELKARGVVEREPGVDDA